MHGPGARPWRRRDFLWATGALAASVTGAASATAASAGGAAPGSMGAQASQRPACVGDFQPGLALGPCRLEEVLPVDQGALPFLLVDPDGRRFVVELHVHDPGVRALARAGSYDVFVRNGGSGRTPTRESHGLGAMALARLVAGREAAGRPIPQLATIVERWASDPPPVFRPARPAAPAPVRG